MIINNLKYNNWSFYVNNPIIIKNYYYGIKDEVYQIIYK